MERSRRRQRRRIRTVYTFDFLYNVERNITHPKLYQVLKEMEK